MSIPLLTKGVILATVVVLIGYDIWAVLTGGIEATISSVILRASHEFPVIPFLAGGLCGHLFFSQEKY